LPLGRVDRGERVPVSIQRGIDSECLAEDQVAAGYSRIGRRRERGSPGGGVVGAAATVETEVRGSVPRAPLLFIEQATPTYIGVEDADVERVRECIGNFKEDDLDLVVVAVSGRTAGGTEGHQVPRLQRCAWAKRRIGWREDVRLPIRVLNDEGINAGLNPRRHRAGECIGGGSRDGDGHAGP